MSKQDLNVNADPSFLFDDSSYAVLLSFCKNIQTLNDVLIVATSVSILTLGVLMFDSPATSL